MWSLFGSQLKSSNPNTRRKAIEKMADSRSPRILDELTEAIHDKDAMVRGAAVAAIGKNPDLKAVMILVSALKDRNVDVRKAIVEALKNRPEENARAGLVLALRDSDAGVRGAAAKVLVARRWRPKDDDEEIWLDVAQGHFTRVAARGPRVIDALAAVLGGSPYHMQVAAIEALGSIADERVFGILLPYLKPALDHTVCAAAIRVISQTGGQKALDALVPLLKAEDHRIRVAAIEAMGKLGIEDAVPHMKELLQDTVWDVRCAVAKALSKMGVPQAVDGLLRATEDPDADVREAAITSLGHLADPAAIGPLVLGLKDPDSNVRRAANSALQLVGMDWPQTEAARRMIPELRAALSSSDQDIRYAAANALEQIERFDRPLASIETMEVANPSESRRRRAIVAFGELLRDPDGDIRMAAVLALGRLGDRRAVPQIKSAQDDTDPSVRRSVAEALNFLGVS